MLKPTQDWVVTKVIEQEERVSAGGVILPGTAAGKEKTKLVQIVSFGPDANPNNILKVGDIVLVQSHTGLKVKHEEEEFELAKADNFLGVVN